MWKNHNGMHGVGELCQHLDSGYSLDFIPALSHWRADYSFDAVIKISQRIYLKSKLIAV